MAFIPIPYKSFAKFYDAVMGDRRKSVADIVDLISKYNPGCKNVLELACGTGTVLKPLKRYYRVSGLDISPEMIAIARRRLGRTKLYLESMTSFSLSEKFDAIVCVFDSINHLTRWSDWLQVFRRVSMHLNPQGIFIFDVNTVTKLKEFALAPTWVHKFNENILLMSVTCDTTALSKWNIRVFEHFKGKNYKLHEENIYEKAFPLGKIKEGLTSVFSSVRVLDLKGRVSVRSDKLHFVCKR